MKTIWTSLFMMTLLTTIMSDANAQTRFRYRNIFKAGQFNPLGTDPDNNKFKLFATKKETGIVTTEGRVTMEGNATSGGEVTMDGQLTMNKAKETSCRLSILGNVSGVITYNTTTKEFVIDFFPVYNDKVVSGGTTETEKSLYRFKPADYTEKRSKALENLTDEEKSETCVLSNNLNLSEWSFKVDVKKRKTVGEEYLNYRVPVSYWSIGVNTIPIKLRFATDRSITRDTTVIEDQETGEKIKYTRVYKDKTVPVGLGASTSFNLGFSFGYARGWTSLKTNGQMTNYVIVPSLFIGPTTADIKATTLKYTDSDEREGFAGENWIREGYDRIAFGLTYGGSIMFMREKLGIIIGGGFDSAFGKNRKNWLYQNKFWLGFGISASFGL